MRVGGAERGSPEAARSDACGEAATEDAYEQHGDRVARRKDACKVSAGLLYLRSTSKWGWEENRDISENIAFGLAKPTMPKESMLDS